MTIKQFFNSPLFIILSGLAFFLPFLGTVHLFDWDEINFAESSREMLVTGDYFKVMVNFEPFWEKPPLFFWLQALSMKIFGVGEFAARLPNAIIGIITLYVFYRIGKEIHSEKFGQIWAMLYLGSFLPHLYFKSGIIDPSFNLFIFTSVYFLIKIISQKKDRTKNALLAGIFNGLAVLTKGPVGFLLFFLTFLVYMTTKRFRGLPKIKHFAVFALAELAITSLWYGVEMYNNGFWFITEFISYQIDLFLNPVAGHQQPFYYHFLVVFIGCFPLSIFALGSFSKNPKQGNPDFRKWMLYLFWVVMLLFSIVETKIVHYSSMAYFPLSFLAAEYILKIAESPAQQKKYIRSLFLFFGIVFSLLLTLVPLVAQNKELLYPYLKDPFAVDCLKTNVEWAGFEFLIGIGYLFGVVMAFMLFKKTPLKATAVICYSTALCLLLYLPLVVSKIEAYSQRPAIEFYEELQGEDVYVKPVGFKSYAHYFYFRQPNENNQKRMDDQWLLQGDIDKPVWFVTKSTNKKLNEFTGVKKTAQKGGFVFYVREP
ncbi:MAG: glycosyl transferase [Flavobacteriales bacterium]|nr:MAG: glycosyl transferase [Flavobacteriales bacterium]